MTTFEARREMLPSPQIALWPELSTISAMGFVLYGGTALALRLGHRESIDFDFFSARPLDKERLAKSPLFENAKVIQDAPDTLTLLVSRAGGTVKVSFFGDHVPKRILGRVGEPEFTDDCVLRAASIDDLFATKVKVVLDRAEAKDYRDIAALLRAGALLERALGAARTIYGPGYQPAESVKALSYFGDGDLATVNTSDRRLLTTAAAAVRSVPAVGLRSADLS
ncbi:MAG: nucleotidyl transferase AbiEii/AbiGii toxin family protein [Candidatus Eremiobacteraeota bacterium]|nr:nucleotidyl transferase AbiEii/AbiGii toxin family protein [Candidatus Eremiobacteraeota bacterium]